jgi:dienelactone hydrolase
MTTPPLAGYESFDFSDGRWTRPVYRRGTGPAVIVMHEMPGLHPLVIRFADRITEAGMTAYLPSLFGTAGKAVTPLYAVGEMVKALCIRREFTMWATDRSSPMVDWLRALARHAHTACGGAGVGAVGMCFTGGFALAMMTEPAVVAPVLSQPSLPAPIGPGSAARRASIGVSAGEIACAKRRFVDEDLTMIGLRFRGDRLVPDERFETYKRTFGDRFEAIEIDAKDAAPDTGMPAHSVLTVHLRDDDPDGPTKRAERRVIEFFRERTRAKAAATPAEA